jgi:hypothetical protein
MNFPHEEAGLGHHGLTTVKRRDAGSKQAFSAIMLGVIGG